MNVGVGASCMSALNSGAPLSSSLMAGEEGGEGEAVLSSVWVQ